MKTKSKIVIALALIGIASVVAVDPKVRVEVGLIGREGMSGTAVVLGGDDRNQVVGIEFTRRFEQYAGPMLGAARRRERRPGGIAGREVEIVAMDGCILLPGEHVTGESEFAQGLAQTLRQFPLERRPVEGLG